MSCKYKEHEAYKNLMKNLLFDFFCDSVKKFYDKEESSVTVKEIQDFVDQWFEARCKDPVRAWLQN